MPIVITKADIARHVDDCPRCSHITAEHIKAFSNELLQQSVVTAHAKAREKTVK